MNLIPLEKIREVILKNPAIVSYYFSDLEDFNIDLEDFNIYEKDINGPGALLGCKYWFKNGQYHREDGPAFEYPGGKEWFLNNKRHRIDGPAIETSGGYKEWWVNDKEFTEEEFNKRNNK